MSARSRARIRREHREAIARMDPDQIRAVRRLIACVSSGVGLENGDAMIAAVHAEDEVAPLDDENAIPDWWMA